MPGSELGELLLGGEEDADPDRVDIDRAEALDHCDDGLSDRPVPVGNPASSCGAAACLAGYPVCLDLYGSALRAINSEYDFGDGGDHRPSVENVLDDPPPTERCTGGRLAYPPEDCVGRGRYDQLSDCVRSSSDDEFLPDEFENAAHGDSWVSVGWHPEHIYLEEANAACPDSCRGNQRRRSPVRPDDPLRCRHWNSAAGNRGVQLRVNAAVSFFAVVGRKNKDF